MIETIKKILPVRFRRSLKRIDYERRLLKAYVSDYLRYRKFASSSLTESDGEKALSALIIMQAHALEKGFSMPEIRAGYGTKRIVTLISLLEKYIKAGYGREKTAFKKAQSVFAVYLRYHAQIGYELGDLKKAMDPWVDMSCNFAGYIAQDRETLVNNGRGDFAQCAISRCSVRSYSKEPVPENLISEAVEIARKTPSVCNRQPWHTYIIKTDELKRKVLGLQNGNRGFGDQADFLAIVTTDLQSFIGPGERNEAFIDGGLFAMSLMYSFHYKGIGSCPLNWMVEPGLDREMRTILNLNHSENIIMIITAGGLPDCVRVAKSVRKDVADIMTFL